MRDKNFTTPTDRAQSTSAKPDVVATAVEVIERNARLQARLVTDLLDISRAISGNLDLELEDVAFTETHRHGVTAFDRVGAR